MMTEIAPGAAVDIQTKKRLRGSVSQTTKLSYSFIIKRLDATRHRKVGEDDGGDGFDDDGGAEGEADIVAAGNVEGGLLSGLDVEGGLGSGDAGGRLEGDAEDYR